jgi:hypothetical protein
MNYQTIVHLEQLRAIAEESPDALISETELDEPKSSSSFDQALTQYCTATLTSNEQLATALSAPRIFGKRAWLISAVVAALLGVLAANTSLQQTGGKINVYWALVCLVAFNLLSLGVWMVGTLLQSSTNRGSTKRYGRSAINAMQWLFARIRPSLESAAWKGWAATKLNGRIGFWRTSRVAHLNWVIYSFSGFLALLVIFSMGYFDFAWGSTLLSDQQFARLTSWMGEPMQWLGIAPETNGGLTAFNTTLDDMQRKTWAQWLMIAVLLYGVAPRLVALLVSHLCLKRAEANAKLDTSGDWYGALRQNLMSTPVFTEITDADQPVATQFPDHELHRLAPPDNVNWIALEPFLPMDVPIDVPIDKLEKELESELLSHSSISAKSFIGTINNTEDLEKLLQTLDDGTSKKSTIVVLVDLQRTPDRGHQRTLSSLASNRDCWLALRAPSTNPLTPNQLAQHYNQWLNLASQSGISEQHIGILPSKVQLE